MTNPDCTLLVLVLDRSGSMISIKDDMEGGIKAFLDSQRELPGDVDVITVKFDTEYEISSRRPLSKVAGVTIEPRGGTALYDALGQAITTVGARLAKLPESERPGLVQFVVVTDGYENASRKYRLAQIAKMVKHQTDAYNWDFLFLGANQDAVLTAKTLGFNDGQSYTYAPTAGGVAVASAGLSNYVTNTRKAGANSTSYVAPSNS